MADSYAALAKTTTATTGTNDYELVTTALTTAHRTPKQAVADGSLSDGDIVQYMARDTTVTGDASFELGEGVYTDATNEIARDAANIHDGSNGPGALTVWPGSGVRDIYLVVSPSVQLPRLDRLNTFQLEQRILGNLIIGSDSTPLNTLHLEEDDAGFIIKDSNEGVDVKTIQMIFSSGKFRIRGIDDAASGVTAVGTTLDLSTGGFGVGLVAPDTNLHLQEDNADTVPAFEIDQLGAGDAALQLSIVGDAYAIGIDNTDDDKFKISYAASSGGAVVGVNDRFQVSPQGDINIPGNIMIGTTLVPSTDLHIHEDNTNTTPAVEVEQLGIGDAALQFSIVGDAYAIGIDNTDDKFKISYASSAGGAVLGTNDRLEIDSLGDVTLFGDQSVDGQVEIALKNDAQEWAIQNRGTDSDKFRIRDITNLTNPFTINPGAPNNSISINQNGQVGIGQDPISIAASAILELSSTTGALLVTRMTTTQRDALTAVNSMIIYNNTTNQMEGRINGAWTAM